MFTRLAARVKAVLHRNEIDAELDDEVRFHVEMETAANVARGMTPTEARRIALRDLGGVTQTKEAVREVRAPWYDSLVQDVKYGLRSFRRSPGFTAVAIITLALGIGANTAIFSLVDAILFRPLPYGDPGRLVWIMGYNDNRGTIAATIDPRAYDPLARSRQNLQRVSCSGWLGPSFTRTEGTGDVTLQSTGVCPDLLDVLGVRPVIGRTFAPDEGRTGNDGVAILSHATWLKHFGGDAAIVGRTVSFKERSITIIGVLPESFVLAPMLSFGSPDMIVPEAPSPRGRGVVVGRLSAGATRAQAQAELDSIDRGLQAASKQPWRRTMLVVPLQAAMFSQIRPLSFVLFGASGCVLLLAVVNLANLLLARGSWRERELAIRASIGAGRGRLIRQLLVEGLLLSAAGGIIGLTLAWLGFGPLSARVPSKLFAVLPAGVDRRVLMFTSAVSVLTGLLAAALPALRLTKPNLLWALQDGRRRNVTGGRRFRGTALVASQMAMVVVLLTAAGLMLNSLVRALTIDLGTRSDQVVVIHAMPPRPVWESPAGIAAFYREAMTVVGAVPGVRRVAGVCTLTVGGRDVPWGAMLREGPRTKQGARYLVTADYFSVLSIAVRGGRTFAPAEIDAAAPVAIVNEAAARQLWPGENAVGKWFKTGDEPAREVVGVVADTRDNYHADVRPSLFVPPDSAKPLRFDIVAVVDGNVGLMEKAIAARLAKTIPPQSVTVESLAEVVRDTTVNERFQTLLLAMFAGLALLLAAVGISGIVGYTVARRTREIGVRLALGSTRWHVASLIVRQSLMPVALGAIVGLVAARGVTRVLTSLLFQVKPTDPATFAAAVVALLLVAVVASLLPARRATRVDPVEALRAE